MTVFCRNIDSSHNLEDINEIEILSQLPLPIRRDVCRELKQKWMKSSFTPMNPWRFEYRDLKGFNCLTKYDFIMLFKHPRNMSPDFWPSLTETAHVYAEFYEHYLSEDNSYVLCRPCFLSTCTPADSSNDEFFDYESYWTGMDWKFYHIVRHFNTSPQEFVKLVLKEKTSWCDRCILTPLFKLYDWESCGDETNVHAIDSDSDSDSVSEINICDRVPLYDPFVV